MAAVLLGIAPVFGLILLGWVLRVSGAFPASAWPVIERLTYFVLFPCLLFGALARTTLDPATAIPVALALIVAIGMTAVGMLALRPRLGLSGPAFTSVFQGSIRPNTYVGLAIIAPVFGPEGVALAAICIAANMPLVNILAVLILTRHGDRREEDRGIGSAFLAMARNPIILSVLAGLAYSLTGLPLPPVVDGMIDILGRASLALGLLSVGAGLVFAGLAGAWKGLATAVAAKLLANPILTLPVAMVLGLGGLPAAIPVIFNGLPVAPSAYILARQLGGDATLMAAITTATTLGAAITLPGLVLLTAWIFGLPLGG